MNWKKTALQNSKLYAVTDLTELQEDFSDGVIAAFEGGADIIQLRSKSLSDRELITAGQILRICADQLGALFFVNDRLDIALAVMADGLHLGQLDMPLAIARKIAERAGHPLLLGKSTHSLEQAVAAEAEGADYIGVGPVFVTPTKPGKNPVGLELVRQVTGQIKLPWVAIGGIDLSNVRRVLDAGAERVACVRAIFSAVDIRSGACRLKREIERKRNHVLQSI